jgi:glutaryl-CoA dehydrogenase
VAREVERVDSGYRSMMSVQSSLVMVPINEFGTEAQKQKYLPKLARGEWVGCFGLTEPNHGSDPGSMVTRAKKVAGGYSLTGARCGSATRPFADVFVVWAKDDGGKIRGFILNKGMPRACRTGHPQQGGPARQHHRRDRDGRSVLPRGRRLPRGARPEGPLHLPEQRPLRHRLGRHGRGRRLLPRARQYVMDRQQFGRPLAANQLIQKKLADMQTEIAWACKACCNWAA